ncbi:LOW QUALITY PROTEIN: hypothetical protein HID58_028044 [Brassica napus]|uniref:Uncharacterized protein n=1 Tax=Brassica napus TaxID=3708 RepID=A0ABQ8CTI7_BRANA|nr:LOW QUALITY PROTEIN: hypothetical protein HID58_028044 [Brassica napus]
MTSPLNSTTIKLKSETKPWELKTTKSDMHPEIETAASAQLTILNMAKQPLIRTSVFEVSLISNSELPAPKPHKVVDETGRKTSSIMKELG